MRDLRKYAQDTNKRLVWGALALILIVGLGLIFVFYDLGGALSGLVCMAAGLAPVILIVLALNWIEKLVERANQD